MLRIPDPIKRKAWKILNAVSGFCLMIEGVISLIIIATAEAKKLDIALPMLLQKPDTWETIRRFISSSERRDNSASMRRAILSSESRAISVLVRLETLVAMKLARARRAG